MKQKKCQIAFVHRSLTAGGVEKVLINMLNEFDYSLFDIDLYLLDYDDFFVHNLNKNVNLIFGYNKLKKEKPTFKFLLSKFKIISAMKVGFFFILSLFRNNIYEKKQILLKSYSKITKKKYKAVICYNGVSKTLLSDSIFEFKAKKRIAWIHGDGYQLVPSDLYSFFDKIFCVSIGVKNDFTAFLPDLYAKTSVLYNVLDTKEILINANEPLGVECNKFTILTVARLSNEKGVLMIPEIVGRLKEDNYCFQWLLIGNGPLEEELAKTIKNKKIEDNLIILGLLKNPYCYMKACDLYVQPSFTEGYCTTTNEAKLFCKPMLVTNVNGMNEQFVDGITGIIVNKIDEFTLYQEIKKIIENPSLRHSLSQNLKNENFQKLNNNLKPLFEYLKK